MMIVTVVTLLVALVLCAVSPGALGAEPAEQSVVLITGCSSGIGKATALKFASNPKYIVVATMRSLTHFKYFDPETITAEDFEAKPADERAVLKQQFLAKYPHLKLSQLDVTQQSDVDRVVAEVAEEFGE